MIRINLKMLFFKQIIAIRSFPQVPEEYDIIQRWVRDEGLGWNDLFYK